MQSESEHISIDEAVESAPQQGAVLLDVRTHEEYDQRHIPSSLCVPLQELAGIGTHVPDKDALLFVFCYSGARSAAAVTALRAMGYTRAVNVGGVADYHGAWEEEA